MKLHIVILNYWLLCHTLAARLIDLDTGSLTGSGPLYRRGGSPIKQPSKSKSVVEKANSAVQRAGKFVQADAAAETVSRFIASNRMTHQLGKPVEAMAHRVSEYVRGDPLAQMEAARPPRLLAEIRNQPYQEGVAYTGTTKVKNDNLRQVLTGNVAKNFGIASRHKVSVSSKQLEPGRMEARVLGKNTQVKLTMPEGAKGHIWVDGPDGKKVRTPVDHTQSPFRYQAPQLPDGAQRRLGAVVEGLGGKVSAKAWNR